MNKAQKLFKPIFMCVFAISIILNLALISTHPFVLSQLKRIIRKVSKTISPSSQPASINTTTKPTTQPAIKPLSGYPIIVKVTDSLGNINTNSWGDRNQGGDWVDGLKSSPIIKAGTTITFTVEASDPENDKISYRFEYKPYDQGRPQPKQNWSINNTFTFTFSEIGKYQSVIVEIKDNNDIYQFSLTNSQTDDYTYMTYEVIP